MLLATWFKDWNEKKKWKSQFYFYHIYVLSLAVPQGFFMI